MVVVTNITFEKVITEFVTTEFVTTEFVKTKFVVTMFVVTEFAIAIFWHSNFKSPYLGLFLVKFQLGKNAASYSMKCC